MKVKFKKLLCGCVALSVLTTFQTVSAEKVGDKTGSVLSTDIIAYIDGVEIPSFNIGGRTAVVVENLNAKTLPFGVCYDDAERKLSIASSDIYGTGGRDSFHFEKSTSSLPVGTPIMDVLFTDIKTFYEGVELESFNIGGFTCIYTDDLAKLCGVYEWDEEKRTVNITLNTEDTKKEPQKPEITSLVKESGRSLPAEESVLTKDEIFNRWGYPEKSHLIKNDDGTFTAVEIDEHINIETYDKEFNLTGSFAIKKELPLFGGLYVGKDYNYIAFGQENLLDDSSREVIRIVIYDKQFVKISEIPVSNCKTAIPFDASAGQMTENDKFLVLHTSRSQYRDESDHRPQTQLTVIVDKSTWTVSNMLGKFQHNHTSHALREFAKFDGDRLITVNYSDAAPIRGAFLQELGTDGVPVKTQSIFNVGGPLGANCTGAMIGGFEISETGYLVSISTIDHTLATDYTNINIDDKDTETRDIYLLWTDKNTWELKHSCLARYTGTGMTGSVPYLVKLENGTFMVLWQVFSDGSNESDTISYAFVDENGVQTSRIFTQAGRLSQGCQPVEADGKLIWYVNTAEGRQFHAVSTDPEFAPVYPDGENETEEESTPSDNTSKADEKEEDKEDATENTPAQEDEQTPPETDTPVSEDKDPNPDTEDKNKPEKPEITIPIKPDKPVVTLPVEPKPPVETKDDETENKKDTNREENKITEVDGI